LNLLPIGASGRRRSALPQHLAEQVEQALVYSSYSAEP
jgi:hypothetical protein